MSKDYGLSRGYSAEEFVKLEFENTGKLVYPWLSFGGRGLILGYSESGKTQLMLSLAIALCEGSFFLSKYKCRKCKVVILSLDTPKDEMQERVQDVLKMHDLEGQLLIEYGELPIDTVQLKNDVVKGNVPKSIQDIRDFAPDVVFIDALTDVIGELDTWKPQVPALLFSAWREILGPTAIWFLHHMRKLERGMKLSLIDEANLKHEARDSAAFIEKSSVSLLIYEENGVRTVKFPKARIKGGRPSPMTVGFHPITSRIEVLNRELTRAVELLEGGFTKSEARKQLMTEFGVGTSRAQKAADDAEKVIKEAQELVKKYDTP